MGILWGRSQESDCQAWGEAELGLAGGGALLGAGPCWGRALDGGGGKLRSRVVARIRPGV